MRSINKLLFAVPLVGMIISLSTFASTRCGKPYDVELRINSRECESSSMNNFAQEYIWCQGLQYCEVYDSRGSVIDKYERVWNSKYIAVRCYGFHGDYHCN